MKPKVQTSADEEQEIQRERSALSRRVFKSNLIRESIARYLKDMPPAKEATAEDGAAEVGISDLSDKHDRYAARIKAQRRTKKK